MGHSYVKKLSVINLKFMLNWVSCVSSGNPVCVAHYENMSSLSGFPVPPPQSCWWLPGPYAVLRSA